MPDAAAMPQSIEVQSWPVKQAERLGLRLGIGWVIDHLWQSTLFAMAIGLLTPAFRRNRARVRYALWFCASVKFLVPFSMMMWLGSIIGSSVLDIPAVLGASDPTGAVGGFGQWLVATVTATLWPSTFTVTQVAAAWFSLALLGIWTCGFFAIVATRLRLSQQLWEVALASRRVELLGVKAPARLQVGLAEGLLEPGVIGWLNPVLLMPADIEQHLTRPELEAVVAHELCHVRRFDNLTAAIHMAVEAVFWFHPLVWWLGARLVDERERACDEHVLRSVGAPGPYAQGILNVCKRYAKSPLASVSGVGGANVRERIEAILANRIGEATSRWKRVMLSGIVFCVLIVPLAAGALQAPPPHAMPSRGATSVGVHALPALPAYALVVARADSFGPGLRRAGMVGPVASSDASANAPTYPAVRPREIAADAMTMPRLTEVLASVVGGGVEDRTGLAGGFTIRLTWTSDPGGPSLFDAVQQQLGLRLVPLQSDAQQAGPKARRPGPGE
jgi:beta-lactamase regulating signal transducer with metallopeptidase domain